MDDFNEDEQFVLWIAKRLVYKYGENPDIISRIATIVKKQKLERRLYYENNQNTIICIDGVIKSLQDLQKIHETYSINDRSKDTILLTNVLSLDDIDMDNFIKGV